MSFKFVQPLKAQGLVGAFLFLLPTLFMFSRAIADLLIVLIGVWFLVSSYRNSSWSWLTKPWVLISAATVVYMGLIVPLLVPQFKLEALLQGLAYYRWPLFAAAMVYGLLSTPERLRVLEIGILVVVLFIIFDTVFQYFNGTDLFGHQASGTRLTGPFSKLVPGTFTVRVFFVLVALVYFSRYLQSELSRLVAVILTLLTGLAFVFLTGERGALLVLGLGSLITGIALFIIHKRQRVMMLIAGALCAVLAVGFVTSQPKMFERSILSTVEYITHWNESASAGVILPTIEIWKDNSIIYGVGAKNYENVCLQEKYEGLKATSTAPSAMCAHPHNIYLQWAVEGGLIGLTLFILFVVLVVRELFVTAWSQQKMLVIFALCAFLTTFWPLMGSMSFFNNYVASIIWLSLVWSLSKCRLSAV